VIHLVFSAAVYSQATAYVTSIQIQGTLTDPNATYSDANGIMTITINRSPDLADWHILVSWYDARYPSNYLVDVYDPVNMVRWGGNGAVDFAPGVNSLTINKVFGRAVLAAEPATVFAKASYAYQDSNGNIINFNDPGMSTGVTVQPITMSTNVTPSTVNPGGSNPELTVTAKNSFGDIVPFSPSASSICDVFNGQSSLTSPWDLSNPSVSAQYRLSVIQPPTTEACSIQLFGNLVDGPFSLTTTVTYQEPLSSGDLGPSSPRSGCEGMCGLPINLTNGNVWVEADDYRLPGLGGGISLMRTWNSQWLSYSPWTLAGMFGDSWQSNLEKNIQVLTGGKQLRYWRGDGSAWLFTSNRTGWTLTSPVDERATLAYSSKTGYTITLRDGSVELYNINGFLAALKDRNGNQTTITYDGTSYNRLTKVTDAAGRTLQFNYANGILPKEVTSIQDSAGTIATYAYAASARLLSVTYADGSIINYNYDSNGLMLSATDQQGKILESHTYDGLRRGTSSQRANGVDALTVSSYYNIGGTSIAFLLNSNNVTTGYYANTKIGNRYYVTQVSGPGCDSCIGRNNQAFSYDGSGNRISSQDPNGNTTTYSYDSNGNVTQTTSSGQTWKYTWNSFGEPLTVTDPLTKVTTYTYDSMGNLLTVKTPMGETTTYAYDTKGELTSIKDPRLNVTTLTYSTAGLIASVKDAQNHLTQMQYDPRGNQTSATDALNQLTTYAYDSRNRLTTITYPTSPATTSLFGYDYRGRRTTVTDANSKVTQYGYDDADRLISVTDASSNVTAYTYDLENNLTQIKDAANNATAFQYDSLGRVTKTTFPSSLIETYNYDTTGNLTSKTDRKNQAIMYGYDPLNRLTSKSYPDSSSVSYTYDLANHLTQISDPTGTSGFSYDADGRLTQASTTYSFISGHTFNVSSGYDAASNRTSMTDPQNAGTTYVYDTLNRLTSLTSPQGAFGFSYDALSRRTQLTRPNNVTTTYGYDSLSRLLSVLHKAGPTTLDGATYAVDNAGNRTSRTAQPSGTATNYTYDLIYQLTQAAQGGSTTESYSYDAVGNRLSSLNIPSYTYNSSNELASTSAATYAYDNNGNPLTKTDSTGTTNYTWDYENRLTSVTLPGSGGTVTFKYDPFGKRIQKSSATGTTNYLYDGVNLFEEIDQSGNVLARYTQGPEIDQPVAEVRSGSVSYYEQDGLSSVTSLSNSVGAIVNTYTYDSFGKLISSTGTLANPFQYTGREFDAEAGLYYYRARYFDPSAGRFLSEDPLSFAGSGTNFYAYVGNEPTYFTDPEGLCKSPKQQCIDDFLKTGYGPLGNFVANTAVPDFSLVSIGTNFWGYAKSSALTLTAKVAIVGIPRALGWLATTTGENMMKYPGLVEAGANAAENGAFWTTTATTLNWIVAPALVGTTAFSTTADLYARWECRNVQ
jgi:RHS repeat-associated protein